MRAAQNARKGGKVGCSVVEAFGRDVKPRVSNMGGCLVLKRLCLRLPLTRLAGWSRKSADCCALRSNSVVGA